MQKTVFIPLGLIVKTDPAATIASIIRFLTPYNVSIYDGNLHERLTLSCKAFNLGYISPEHFANAFFEDVVKSTSRILPHNTLVELRAQWPQVWEDLWNSQCKVTYESYSLLAAMANVPASSLISYVIIGDTNATHWQHITQELSKLGCNLETIGTTQQIFLSFRSRMPVANIMQAYIQAHPQAQYFRVRGPLNFPAGLTQEARIKEAEILDAIPQCQALQILAPYLSVDVFTKLQSELQTVPNIPDTISKRKRSGPTM